MKKIIKIAARASVLVGVCVDGTAHAQDRPAVPSAWAQCGAHRTLRQDRAVSARPWQQLLALAGLLCVATPWVAAQPVDVTPRSPAQALQCLERREAPPVYSKLRDVDRHEGRMRVLLRFSKPDAAPAVEVLANTAREDMQDEFFRYLGGFRLPCLASEDGEVSLVQELHYNATDLEPLPFEDGEAARRFQCLVMPRKSGEPVESSSYKVEHVVALLAFDGDGEQEPKIRTLHSSGDRQFEKAVYAQASQYRMPCRRAGDKPTEMRQVFTLVPYNARYFRLTRERFGLMEFLSMTADIRQVQADFDFKTMSCPFSVRYHILGPTLPNEVTTVGKRDPNRVAFLKWLSERQLVFNSKVMADSMFGERLQIDVPCGHLQL